MLEKRGTEIILDALRDHGIRQVFGYPGGCVIPLFDEFLNYPDLQMVLVRHEQGATHAADGLARVTGVPQVVIATSGPGATNCLTGLATAQMDSVPMVCITGQVRRAVIGTDAFQETNVVGVSRPITKHNYLVRDIADLKQILYEAFYIAGTGRMGPVLIDIPVDVQREVLQIETLLDARPVQLRGYDPKNNTPSGKVVSAWEFIKTFQRPLIYAGGGINQAQSAAELTEFAKKAQIPVATTLLGQGIFPEDHHLSLGMLGMHGTYTANKSTNLCDLLLVFGARFDDRVTGNVAEFAKQAKILHVDIDSSSLDKIKTADFAVHGDVKKFLNDMLPVCSKLPTEGWIAQLQAMQQEYPEPNYDHFDSATGALRPEFVIKQLSELTGGDAYIVTDVGQHQMFACLHYTFKRERSHLTSGGLGTMGYSLPAAMGACYAAGATPVISISGDGGFQMNMQELATIRENSIPVKIIILNNKNLGMVKQWQDLFWENRYSSTIFDQNPDFVTLASAFDIPAYRVSEKGDVQEKLELLLKHEGPALIEFMIDKHAHVYPMIPAGQTVNDIIVKAVSTETHLVDELSSDEPLTEEQGGT